MMIYWLLIIKLVFIINKSLTCTPPAFTNLSVPSNFSLNRFLGRWYEVQWLPSQPHNESDIWRDFFQDFKLENNVSQRIIVPGQARLLNQDQCFSFGPWLILANNSAKMILETQKVNSSTILNWPFYVLDIDYDRYVLIYGCGTDNYTYSTACQNPLLWVLSRTPRLSNEFLSPIDKFIEKTLCINLTKLEITPQSEKPCGSSSFSFTNSSMNRIIFFNLFISYLFLIYK